MKILVFVVISVALLNAVHGAHLLAMHFVATGSYIRIMESVLHNLAQEHQITLYSIVHDDFPHPNVTVVKVYSPPPKMFFFGGLFEILCDSGIFYVNWNVVLGIQPDFVENIFADPNVQKLLVTKEKYDAIITFATFAEFTIQFADLFKIPLIEISATVPFTHINDAVGNPTFLTTTNSFYAIQRADTFFQRVENYIYNLRVHLRYNWIYLPSIEAVTKKYFPPGTRPIESLHRNTSLLLSNSNNAMGYARPNMPNVVEIGGIHCRPAKPLPPDLEEFISGSGEHGIIYISFGSSIRSKFPDYIKQSFLRVFERLPQRILWKWNEEISNLPPNVRISKWFSQQDILGHNKTKLFITQSGMFSMQESAYHGVPVLAIPIAFDQPLNAILANDLGYCEYMYFCDFTEEHFYFQIQQLISNPKYKNNAQKISKLMNDHPFSQKMKMSWWVNYILRHNGNPLTDNLKDKSYGLQRLDVDIILFLVACILLSFILSFYIICWIFKFIPLVRKSIRTKEKKA